MKTRYAVLPALALALAFCTSANAQGPGGHPQAPSKPLTEVTTDATTLSGNGTSADPLKIKDGGVGTAQIAAGAVTPDKINAAGAAVGQVLTARGDGSAGWQPAQAAQGFLGLRIADSDGKVVGYFLYSNAVLLSHAVDGQQRWFAIGMTTAGFGIPKAFAPRYYLQADCAGTVADIIGETSPFITAGWLKDGLVYYNTGAVAPSDPLSFRDSNGVCNVVPPPPPLSPPPVYYVYASFPVSELGTFNPPFKLVK